MSEPLTSALVIEELDKLRLAFPSRQGEKNIAAQADIYRNGLNGLSGDAVRAAVRLIIQQEEFFPKVAKIREVATNWQRRAHGEIVAQRNANDDPDECAVCFARAAHEDIPVTEARGSVYVPVRDEHGQPVVRRSVGKIMRHDFRVHFGTAQRNQDVA